VKPFDWNEQKNSLLKEGRGIGFEEVVNAIVEGRLLDVIKHPNAEKYPNQKLYVLEIDNYAYTVPFVETAEIIFLKTIFPSRKYTKQYLRKEDQ
jgi:uncharacterized DUF497 family protein